MSELMNFRSIRSPQRRIPDQDDLIFVTYGELSYEKGNDYTGNDYLCHFKQLRSFHIPERLNDSEGFVDDPTYSAIVEITNLDKWLAAYENNPNFNNFQEYIKNMTVKIDGESWKSLRQIISTKIINLLLINQGYPNQGDPELCALMTRLLLIMGLVELYVEKPNKIQTSIDIYNALRWRTIVLPSLDQFEVNVPGSVLVRRPGFADLFLVREEWNRYEAGEISYIENILGGEQKERKFIHIDETKQETTTETEQTKFEERDTQTTDRAELHNATTSDSALALHVEGQVDTSGQYGPTKVDTHLGGSLDYSVENSNSHAITQSKESVSRAVTSLEQKVSEIRKTMTLVKNKQIDKHAFHNETQEPIVGVYRWVDEIKRVQVVKYPHRFMMEFEVPEPGAWYRWLHEKGTTKGLVNRQPIPFTLDGKPESTENQSLNPKQINADNYLELGARYFTPGLQTPPKNRAISTSIKKDALEDLGSIKDPKDKGKVKYDSNTTLTIPDGYQAAEWKATVFSWQNYTQAEDDKQGEALWLSVGGSVEPVLWGGGYGGYVGPICKSGNVGHISEGTVPVSLMANTANGYSINVDLTCSPLDETIVKWQIDTFELIAGAYFAMKNAYDNEIASRQVQQGGILDANSPEQNQEIVKEELKKQIIGMLTESKFGGSNPVRWDGDPDKPPQTDPSLVVSSAPKIQFLEQAFEWENLTYILYPYYWADPLRWTDLEPIEGKDPDFARFLRSGSARVVVPARKGFEHHVQLYLWLGIIWSGGSVPVAGDETYLSIADEIKSMQRGADDGIPIDSWEVRLPTTLVWLENKEGLPENKYPTIEYPFND